VLLEVQLLLSLDFLENLKKNNELRDGLEILEEEQFFVEEVKGGEDKESQEIGPAEEQYKLWNSLKVQLRQEKPRENAEFPHRHEKGNIFEYKQKDIDLEYLEILPEPVMDKIDLFGKKGRFGIESYEGRIIQGLRFQMLTQAVERKYNLPPNLLLAMLIHETGAEEFLPNAIGDGGFGLIHMQSGTAKEFGLKVFKDCGAIVCNGKSSRSCKDEKGNLQNHARELQNIVDARIDDREHLGRTDFRLHHLYNIDTAGRILAFHISRYPDSRNGFPEKLKDLGPLRAAICRYSGHVNYPQYVEKIIGLMTDLQDADFIKRVKEKFDKVNENNVINDNKLDLHAYLREWQTFLLNYDLKKYVDSRCYTSKYSDNILATYKTALIREKK
jgi:hypothetical protein